MQNYFSVKCYTEWTNSCSGNAEKNDVKYSRKFEHTAPINTWTNFANRMYDCVELWTGKLSPRLESSYPGNKCNKDLTITQQELSPWQCEIKLQDICACLYGPFFVRIPMFLLFHCLMCFAELWAITRPSEDSQNTEVCTRACTWVFDTVGGRSKYTIRWFNISPVVFISMFIILSIKNCGNNSELSFYWVCYFSLIRDLQNSWKVKATLEVENAKPQNLKSNPTW